MNKKLIISVATLCIMMLTPTIVSNAATVKMVSLASNQTSVYGKVSCCTAQISSEALPVGYGGIWVQVQDRDDYSIAYKIRRGKTAVLPGYKDNFTYNASNGFSKDMKAFVYRRIDSDPAVGYSRVSY